MFDREVLQNFDCGLFISDVDGVLTDGRLYYGEAGELFKVFNARDGLGLIKARERGLKTALITGRKSKITEIRARELEINFVYQGIEDKARIVRGICCETGIAPARTAYLGDDTNDLPALEIVGLPLAVQDAVEEVKQAASYITRRRGGSGAVREVLDCLIPSGKEDKYD